MEPTIRSDTTTTQVLVIDDSTTVRMALRDILAGHGYAVHLAASGDEGFQVLARHEVDVIILDLIMEGTNGDAVLTRLKADADLSWIPVILLTAVADRAELVRCLDLGADDFIVKPWDERELLGRIRTMARLKCALDEVTQSRSDLHALLDAPVQASVLVDRAGKVLAANEVAARLFDIDRDSLAGCNAIALAEQRDWSDWASHLRHVLLAAEPAEFEEVRDDLAFRTCMHPVFDPHGEPNGATIATWDITAQRELQIKLTHASKLESIGQLAAGIAHEVNTPTQYVGNNVTFLQEAFEDITRLLGHYAELANAHRAIPEPDPRFEPILEHIEQCRDAIDIDYLLESSPEAFSQTLEGIARITKIVKSMKEFSHPGTDDKAPTCLGEAIESTVTVCANEWKYVADVVTEFGADLDEVPLFRSEFNQVILNIVTNAAHAIAEVQPSGDASKGTIRISTRRCGASAEIRIADSGPGIPEEIASRIFDPFFTTKEVGKGTGQGLAIAYSIIVDKHGGEINVGRSEFGGAEFVIRLPLDAEARAAA